LAHAVFAGNKNPAPGQSVNRRGKDVAGMISVRTEENDFKFANRSGRNNIAIDERDKLFAKKNYDQCQDAQP
jgi:hypothetical protein